MAEKGVEEQGLAMERLQKRKQGQTNFFEIHLTLLHIFYVLFHSDTWMSLDGTRTFTIQTPCNYNIIVKYFLFFYGFISS